MKQFDYETSSYKHKEDIKAFVDSFNDLANKYAKSFENADADLNKISLSIDKKNASIEKIEISLLDFNKRVDELNALKERANDEIKDLTNKKGEIAYTDSEVQKMELDDINSQITSKKGKISKIDAKIDATKTKIKTNTEEKKSTEKELKELEKQRKAEEEALFRTEGLLSLIAEVKEQVNSKVLEIINVPYRPKKEEVPVVEEVVESPIEEEPKSPAIDFGSDETIEVATEEPTIEEEDMDVIELTGEDEEEPNEPTTVLEPEPLEIVENDVDANYVSVIEDIFKRDGLSLDDFVDSTKNAIVENAEAVIRNLEILKKHNVPLEYTIDQSEILYNISAQDLDDLLSIITTDDEGNGMGFTIDYTFNILKELSKINVDRLIDVYNSEFMNVNAKSGIIHLLKLTNPNLVDFDKNRRTNIEILKSLGVNKVDEIIKNYPEFVDLDNPLFVNVLNVFDKDDLVGKLNSDLEVIPKILEYWKNN